MAPHDLSTLEPTGTLVLIATPVGRVDDLSAWAAQELGGVDVLACEDTRRTRRLLAALGVRAPRLRSVRRENEAASVDWCVRQLRAGRRVGLVSDAGVPGVSDPGQRLVDGVRAAGGEVVVVPGPSAVSEMVARVPWLADGFVFEGFAPRSGAERTRLLDRVAKSQLPSVLFESPRRVEAMLDELRRSCGHERRVMVGKDLTKTHERVVLGTLATPIGPPLGEYVLVIDGVDRRDATG